MQEIQQLRSQITSIARTQLPENRKILAAKLTPPNVVQVRY
jgi:flagellin-like hook-associated protein FlgL